jgi:hypothetical protein
MSHECCSAQSWASLAPSVLFGNRCTVDLCGQLRLPVLILLQEPLASIPPFGGQRDGGGLQFTREGTGEFPGSLVVLVERPLLVQRSRL